MSANYTPALAGQQTAVEPYAASSPPVAYAGSGAQMPTAAQPGAQLARLLGAFRRYLWLILAVGVVGTIGGVIASRLIDPQYQVQSTLLLTGDNSRGSGPIRDVENVSAQGWMDLLRSYAIADSVVMRLALYVRPDDAKDAALFRDFTIDRNGYRPGNYTLTVTGPRWTLRDAIGIGENGIVGEPIGKGAGFIWRPSKSALGDDRKIKFTVRTPRETSVETMRRMSPRIAKRSNMIIIGLTGRVQDKPAATLNAWGEQFVQLAGDLKTARLTQFSRILNAQRAEAADRLVAAERALQSFRVSTIALPSEGTAVTPGTALSTNSVIGSFFAQKFQLESIRRDRQNLERVAEQVTPTSTPIEALYAVGTITNDPIATPLRNSIQEYQNREIQLRLLRRTYTDSNPIMVPRLAELATLQATIPQQLQDVIGQIRQREQTLEQTIAGAARELEGIPSRAITEESLRREVQNASALYSSLQGRFAEAELSEKSTIPDVRILDAAVMPLKPTTNTAPRIIGLAIAGSLGVGLGLAFLLDRFDRRFRYPAQATDELGLQILGVVPVVDETRRQSPEQVAQIIEAFRSIRMNVRYASMPTNRVALTITSPGPNDGKSLIASNLALSFAEGGWRTVLIDGDLRRGQLNATFDITQSPGLVEYLEGTSLLSEVLYQANHENLLVIPSGQRHRRAPELLATPRMQELLVLLARDYDAVIVDSPPLGAGTDAYALGAATGNIAVVLRGAHTDVRMAEAKLKTLDQLPVRVIGAVLNAIKTDGAYQYYSYDPEYAVVEETTPTAGQLTETAGSR